MIQDHSYILDDTTADDVLSFIAAKIRQGERNRAEALAEMQETIEGSAVLASSFSIDKLIQADARRQVWAHLERIAKNSFSHTDYPAAIREIIEYCHAQVFGGMTGFSSSQIHNVQEHALHQERLRAAEFFNAKAGA